MKSSALCLALCISGSSAMITWTPKPGVVYKFTQKGTIHDPAKSSGIRDLSVEMNATETVDRVDSSGDATLTEQRVPVRILVDGQDVTKKVSGHPMASFKLVRRADGEEDEVAPDALRFGFRIEGMDAVIYPRREIAVGETWTYSAIGDPSKDTASCRKIFTYRGQEKVDGILSNKVDYVVEEVGVPNPATGSGTVWLSAEDGELVRKRFRAKNVRLKVAQAGAVDYSLNMDRTL